MNVPAVTQPSPLLFPSSGDADTGPLLPMALPRDINSLLDLLYDGLYVVFLLKNNYAAKTTQDLKDRLKQYIATFERGARVIAKAGAEEVYLCKFAFTALVDETVLMHQPGIRDEWRLRPLQLDLFGEMLAGERFFEYLEKLRQERDPKVQVLEVYHMCLLLGFQGRYITEGSEKLGYLTSRLGEEIAQLKGRKASFAPFALPPDRIMHKLRTEVPLWVIGSIFALMGVLAFMGLRWSLDRQTQKDLNPYQGIVQMPAQPAYIVINLP